MPTTQQAAQSAGERWPALRDDVPRRRGEQPVEGAIADEPSAGGDRLVLRDLCGTVDRDDARSERLLGLDDTLPGDPVILGEPHGKPGQRAVGLGKLQAAKAG